MMYLLFNQYGAIKDKQINELVIQGSNNVNKIGVAIDGVDPTSFALVGVCKLPNGEMITTNPQSETEEIVDGIDGVVFSLTEDLTALSGTLRINIQAINTSTDEVITSYTVYLCVNEGVNPGEIVMMTAQQYQNLMSIVNSKSAVSGTTNELGKWATLTINGTTHNIGGEADYIAGTGIDITGLTISVDTDVIATKEYVNSQVSSAYKFQGTRTISQLNALTVTSSMNGFVYNVSDTGTLNQGSVAVLVGDNVAIVWDESTSTWSWDKLAGTFTVDLSNYYTKSESDARYEQINNVQQIKTQSTGSATSIQMKFWKGTQAQYDSITTKDANTFYIII